VSVLVQHLFALDKRDDLLRQMSEAAAAYIGVNLAIKKKTVTLQQFRDNRLGKFSNDMAITSLAEFPVSKVACGRVGVWVFGCVSE
jgi:hypothetical protein